MNTSQFRKYGQMKKWEQFEEEVSDYMDGRRTKGSGNSAMDKGDIRCDDYLIECKCTEKDAYLLNVKTWEKIVDEAMNLNRTPLFACRSKCGDFFIWDALDYEDEDLPDEQIVKNKTFKVARSCQLTLQGERITHNLICVKVDLEA